MTDARGLPITLKLTAGQAHDGRSADDMLGTLGPGQTLLTDAAYDSNRLRDHLTEIDARAVIRLISRRSDPPPLDHDANFLALVKRAATRIWLRVYESVA